MTGISDELVRRGLIIREHNQLDRRKIMLSLTPRGKVVADCILDQP
jgi:DNA-binding MarR family transcriptional regulator